MSAKKIGAFFKEVEVRVPDGHYRGFWGGYHVRIEVDGQLIQFKTDNGIRGLDVPVVVRVKDGAATVERVEYTKEEMVKDLL